MFSLKLYSKINKNTKPEATTSNERATVKKIIIYFMWQLNKKNTNFPCL